MKTTEEPKDVHKKLICGQQCQLKPTITITTSHIDNYFFIVFVTYLSQFPSHCGCHLRMGKSQGYSVFPLLRRL